jgi:hypothetical protein
MVRDVRACSSLGSHEEFAAGRPMTESATCAASTQPIAVFHCVPTLSYRSRQAGTQLFAGMDRQTGSEQPAYHTARLQLSLSARP